MLAEDIRERPASKFSESQSRVFDSSGLGEHETHAACHKMGDLNVVLETKCISY